MRSDRRIALTSGILTFVTRTPATLRPRAWAAACFMLSISSFPNLLMGSRLVLPPPLEDARQSSHHPFLVRRQIFAPRLGVDHQEIQGPLPVMVEVDDPYAAALAASFLDPSDLAHAARIRDEGPDLGISRNEIDELLALRFVPDLLRLANEERRLRNRDQPGSHISLYVNGAQQSRSLMSKPLADRIALVTGASRGIGYATGIAIARAGAHVVAVARTVGGIEELDDAISKLCGALR